MTDAQEIRALGVCVGKLAETALRMANAKEAGDDALFIDLTRDFIKLSVAMTQMNLRSIELSTTLAEAWKYFGDQAGFLQHLGLVFTPIPAPEPESISVALDDDTIRQLFAEEK